MKYAAACAFALITLLSEQALSNGESKKSYLCIDEKAVGFSYKSSGGWSAEGVPAGTKFITRQPSDGDLKSLKGQFDERSGVDLVVFEFGILFTMAPCHGQNIHDLYYCDVNDGSFWFNEKTLRFQRVNNRGYVVFDENSTGVIAGTPYVRAKPETPLTAIGTCSPL